METSSNNKPLTVEKKKEEFWKKERKDWKKKGIEKNDEHWKLWKWGKKKKKKKGIGDW